MNQSYSILLVEDNADDVFFLRRAFTAAGLEHPLNVVTDGQAAMDYLQGIGEYRDRNAHPLPRLVIADLKMPRVGGFELVQWMRQDPVLRLIPVVVLSSSSLAADVNRAYALGANAYMIKPPDPRALDQLFQTIAAFWTAGEPPQVDWSATPTTANL